MAASKVNSSTVRQPQDSPWHVGVEKVAKMRKSKRGKGKEDVGTMSGMGGVEMGRPVPSGENTAEASTSASAMQEAAWPWVSITDSSASRHPAIFTKDGSYFFSVVGSSVKIYSSSTGQVVSTLSASSSGSSSGAGGHSDLITSALLNPHNAFQLITGSLNGYIKVWDFFGRCALADDRPRAADLSPCCSRKIQGLRLWNPTEENGAVLRVSLKPTNATAQSSIQKSSDITGVGKTRLTHGLAVSPSGTWLVAIGGHKAYVALTSNLKAGFTKFVSPEALTCLAFHPTEEYFATGDDKGNIRLWYCLDESIAVNVAAVEKRAPTTTLHWHAHAVSALAFTPNGAYLLSGGEESVLVIWQLHSGKKEFVPRVGAPILSIAVSRDVAQEEEYLLGLADSSFVFVNSARLKVSRAYSRIKLDPAISHSRPSTTASVPLAVHSLSSTLILPSSHPSSLQTYSPSSSKLVSEIEISPSNRVSRRDEKALEPSRVEQAVISSTGEWMATIDSREGDESFRGEIYLKIWWWDKTSASWILNTRIDRPHGLTKMTAIAFAPARDRSALLLVTTGEDGNIKSWRVRVVKDKNGVEEGKLIFQRFCFGVGPYVVLYDPMTNAVLQVLATPECNSVISAHFLGSSSRYLAAIGQFDIAQWDLITQTLQWHYHSPLPLDIVIPHPQDEMIAAFQRQSTASNSENHTRVLIFTPTSAVPYRTYTLPFWLRSVAFYPSSSSKVLKEPSFSLVGITDSWSVVLFGNDVRGPSDEGATAKGIIDGATGPRKRTLFQDIFGKSAFADLSNEPSALPSTSPMPAHSWSGKDVANIFDAPSYLMPPLETLFDSIIDGFLKPRPLESEDVDASEAEAEGGDADEDVEMDIDAEEGNRPIVVGERLDRVIDWREMNTFIEVFRQHAIKPPAHPPASIPRPQPNGNGIHKPSNGSTFLAVSKANGIARPETPVAYPSPESRSSSEPSSPAAIGKKRKKSAASS
ncbi:hypothetical protein EW146_g7353 [Bondarzewia mesenterica]|uniref:WD repeat-containing protein 75 second beta-propeller domain-containing protein n=1 Tax=Bondarzewia mesenterica TaxID=1095465 RepID=A0A4S4LMU5_9AGAM|nr:hypothetical protein EW146_g7353 [Bondarzewia mesenterica]